MNIVARFRLLLGSVRLLWSVGLPTKPTPRDFVIEFSEREVRVCLALELAQRTINNAAASCRNAQTCAPESAAFARSALRRIVDELEVAAMTAKTTFPRARPDIVDRLLAFRSSNADLLRD